MARNRRKRSGRRAGSFRTCLGCRNRLPRKASVRLVCGPGGEILPDLSGRLPGRGVHLCPDIRCFEQAASSGAVTRSLKKATGTLDPGDLFSRFRDSSLERIRSMLAVTLRSGWLLAGRTVIREALGHDRLALVLLAKDASGSLRREFVELASRANVPCRVILTQAELSSYHHGKPLAVLGVRHRGLARRIQEEVEKAAALEDSVEANKVKKTRQLTAKRVSGKMPKQRTGAPRDR